ncbi:MAG TPA: T3SS effector HopA1 family protein, partial [Euzebya sp.]|nr:T3SS effector HopA1 family protein [Euzebya sp.]
TAALAGTGLSWTLKVGGDPRTLTRADGAVVYLPDESLDTALQLLLPAVDGLLHPDVPPLTCRVAPGLAWAHDPGDGRSFGEDRCGVIASAVAAVTDRPATTADVAAAFRRNGLDPAAPHLRAAGDHR